MQDQQRGFLYAAVAAILFATSPVLIRWSAPLSAYEVTAGRLAVAAVGVWAVAGLQKIPLWPKRADLPVLIGLGAVTALHFVLYIASLSFTTIAHALALVYTAPMFTALGSIREGWTRRQSLGIGVTVVGVAILAGFEPHWTGAMVLGDLMAVGSAVMFAIYSVTGRSWRTRYPLLTYAGTVYGLAALWALPAAGFAFTPQGYGWPQLGAVIALGLLPLGVGHTLYNAALRLAPAPVVNGIAAQEVTGGVLLGALLLQEVPTPQVWLGVLVMLLGGWLLV